MGELKSYRQNGQKLEITETKLEHQRRQILRREARKLAKKLKSKA